MSALGLSLLICSVLGSVASAPVQDPDVAPLVERISHATSAQLPDWSFVKGGELPAGTGDFFLAWTRGKESLNASCRLYDSPADARRELRRLRMGISAGVPDSLPRVADEAYILRPYGTQGTWRTYFSRERFVCQAGGGPEAATRALTQILSEAIDEAR